MEVHFITNAYKSDMVKSDPLERERSYTKVIVVKRMVYSVWWPLSVRFVFAGLQKQTSLWPVSLSHTPIKTKHLRWRDVFK